MNHVLEKISEELKEGNIIFSIVEDTIHIPLPYDFGVLEISITKEGEDSIQLINGDFHTHGSIEAINYETTNEKGIRKMVEDFFNGKFLLIEEQEPGKNPVKLVRVSKEDYLKYLPTGTTYTIYNEI